MGDHRFPRILNSVPGPNQQQVDAKVLLLEGKIIRLQFDRKLDRLDLTGPEAIKLGHILLEQGAKLVV